MTNNQDAKQIEVIVNYMNRIKRYYEETQENEEKVSFINNKTLTVYKNEIQELAILKRIFKQSKNKIEEELYNEFMEYRGYPYKNFSKIQIPYITYTPTQNIDVIRYTNIKHIKNKDLKIKKQMSTNQKEELQLRVSNPSNPIHLVGLSFLHKRLALLGINNLKLVQYNTFNRNLVKSFDGEKFKKTNVFIFDQNDSQENLMDKLMIIYDNFYNQILNIVRNFCNKFPNLNIYYYLKYLRIQEKKFFKLETETISYIKLMKHIYRKSSFKAKDIKDEIEEKPINFNILKKKQLLKIQHKHLQMKKKKFKITIKMQYVNILFLGIILKIPQEKMLITVISFIIMLKNSHKKFMMEKI